MKLLVEIKLFLEIIDDYCYSIVNSPFNQY